MSDEEMDQDEAIRTLAPLPEWEVKDRHKANLTWTVIRIIQLQFETWPTGEAKEYYCKKAQGLGQDVREYLFHLPADPWVLRAFALVVHLDKLAALLAARKPDLDRYWDHLQEFVDHLMESVQDWPEPKTPGARVDPQ